jgi:hypothetical protein
MDSPCAYLKFGGHTCIVYKEDAKKVFAVAMSTPELARICVDKEAFHAEWKPIQGCDAQMAAERYLKGNIPYSSNINDILKGIIKMEQTATSTTKPGSKQVLSVRPGADVSAKPAAAKPAAAKPAAAKPAAAKPAAAKPLTAEERKAAKDAFFAQGATPAKGKPAAKGKEVDAKPAKAKAPKAPKLDDTDVIKLLKGAENRRGNADSIRSQVFAKIKDGITVGAVVKACLKFTNEKQVMSDLIKLANHATNPVISFSKGK